MSGLTKLMDAMKGEKSDDRARESMSFSTWLTENMENNPLGNKTETEKIQKTQPEILSQTNKSP